MLSGVDFARKNISVQLLGFSTQGPKQALVAFEPRLICSFCVGCSFLVGHWTAELSRRLIKEVVLLQSKKSAV